MSDETHDLLGGDFTAASAPADNENGYFVVQGDKADQNIDSVVNAVADAVNSGKDEFNKVSAEVKDEAREAKQAVKKVLQEADSSTGTPKPSGDVTSKKTASADQCSACPYYKFGCDALSKIKIPPQVENYILWKNPKVTAAILATSLVLLISLACCSLLSVISSLVILALSVAGAYRFYLAVIFRIKGTQDETFEKLSSMNWTIPKDKVQDLTRMLETDVNRIINHLKAIILWDNVFVSAGALIGFYVIYCIGSVFNTITLLIIALVTVFTLPKVYQVYKKPIDQALEKTSNGAHQLVKQIQTKFPFLKKKKVQ